jgi:hypothetical protein
MQDGFGWTPTQDCGLGRSVKGADGVYNMCVMDIERASEEISKTAIR